MNISSYVQIDMKYPSYSTTTNHHHSHNLFNLVMNDRTKKYKDNIDNNMVSSSRLSNASDNNRYVSHTNIQPVVIRSNRYDDDNNNDTSISSHIHIDDEYTILLQKMKSKIYSNNDSDAIDILKQFIHNKLHTNHTIDNIDSTHHTYNVRATMNNIDNKSSSLMNSRKKMIRDDMIYMNNNNSDRYRVNNRMCIDSSTIRRDIESIYVYKDRRGRHV